MSPKDGDTPTWRSAIWPHWEHLSHISLVCHAQLAHLHLLISAVSGIVTNGSAGDRAACLALANQWMRTETEVTKSSKHGVKRSHTKHHSAWCHSWCWWWTSTLTERLNELNEWNQTNMLSLRWHCFMLPYWGVAFSWLQILLFPIKFSIKALIF